MKATKPPTTCPTGADNPCFDRRTFVLRVAGLSLVGLVPACASLAAVTVRPEQGRVRLRFLHHPALLEPGGQLRLRAEDTSSLVYVLALPDGDFAAVSPVCTHQGCTVDISGRYLVCPCHGSTYERDGTVVRGPAPGSLRRFPVSRTQDGLVIDLGVG